MSPIVLVEWDDTWKVPSQLQKDALLLAVQREFKDPKGAAYVLFTAVSSWWHQILQQWGIMREEGKTEALRRMLGPEWSKVVQACESAEAIIATGWDQERGWWNPPQSDIPAMQWVVHRLRVAWLCLHTADLPIPMTPEFTSALTIMCCFLGGHRWHDEFDAVSPKYHLWEEEPNAPKVE